MIKIQLGMKCDKMVNTRKMKWVEITYRYIHIALQACWTDSLILVYHKKKTILCSTQRVYRDSKHANNQTNIQSLISCYEVCNTKHNTYNCIYSLLNVRWVRNKSCQPDWQLSEQTNVAGGRVVVVPPSTLVCSEKRKSGWQNLFLTHITNPDEWEYTLSYQSITAMDTVQSTPFDPSCTPP